MILRRHHGKAIRVQDEPSRAEKVTGEAKLENTPTHPAFDDVTKAEIRELLKAEGVDFNKSDNKVVLYDRLTANE